MISSKNFFVTKVIASLILKIVFSPFKLMQNNIRFSIFSKCYRLHFYLKGIHDSEKTNPLKYARCCMMISKYIKYLPWMILGTLSSYLLATDYARNSI